MQLDEQVVKALMIWAKCFTEKPRLEFSHSGNFYRCEVYSSGYNLSDITPVAETVVAQ